MNNPPRRFIRDMVVTEVAWVVPWALWKDHREQLWLSPTYTAGGSYAGSQTVRVHRKADGYWVFREPGSGGIKVQGLRPEDDVPDESPPPPVLEPNPLAESQDDLAKLFDELGESELATMQRKIAAMLRVSPGV
jgi:hypothetical protein